jgi:hypothetical protein
MGILLLTRSHLRPLACANNTNEHWHISSFAFPLLEPLFHQPGVGGLILVARRFPAYGFIVWEQPGAPFDGPRALS